jgi:predicted alpha/beta hydrolase family esterase
MKNKPQILYIHGGETFKTREDYLSFLKTRKVFLGKRQKWFGEYLDKELDKKFEITKPRMPLQDFAKYEDWKIHFERYVSLLNNDVILIGTSLGGIFLAKYLSENKFPKRILSTYLVCPPFDNTLPKDDLVGGFKLKKNLSLFEKQSKSIIIFFSQDDDTVPASQAEKYKKKLPNAKIVIFKSKNGHFRVAKFPEIVKMIKEDLKSIK